MGPGEKVTTENTKVTKKKDGWSGFLLMQDDETCKMAGGISDSFPQQSLCRNDPKTAMSF
jgi:hypothetical protein